MIRYLGLDVALDYAATHVRRAARAPSRPLVVLAHVNQARARLHAFESLTDVNLADARLRVVNDLQKSFGVFHTAPPGKAKGKL